MQGTGCQLNRRPNKVFCVRPFHVLGFRIKSTGDAFSYLFFKFIFSLLFSWIDGGPSDRKILLVVVNAHAFDSRLVNAFLPFLPALFACLSVECLWTESFQTPTPVRLLF